MLGLFLDVCEGAPSAAASFLFFSLLFDAFTAFFVFFSFFLRLPGQHELSCNRKQNKYMRNTMLTPNKNVKKP